MPGMDRTGPIGTGPIGRGMGLCFGRQGGHGRGNGFNRGNGKIWNPILHSSSPIEDRENLVQQKESLEAQLEIINKKLQE